MKVKRSSLPFRSLGSPRAAAVLLLTALLPAGAHAQTTFQYVGLGDKPWSDGKNWDINKPPQSDADTSLVFSGSPDALDSVNDLGVFTLNSMYFAPDAGKYTISGDPLSFVANAGTAPTLYNDSASSIALANSISLLNDISVGGAGDLYLTGAVSGNAAFSKVGVGTLYLSAPKASSTIGVLYLNSGAMVIDTGSQVSATSGAFNRIGGSLTVDGAGSSFTGYINQMTGAISVTNGGLLSSGRPGSDGNGFVMDLSQGRGSVTVTGQGSRWVNEQSNVNLSSSFGSVSLTISDGGVGEIGGALTVQRGATVTVDRGSLTVDSLRDSGTLSSSFVALSDAPGGGSALTLQGQGNSDGFGFGGLIKDAAGGSGSITITEGSYRLNNTANTYSGGTFLNGGFLRVSSIDTLGSGGLYFNGGSLTIGGDTTLGAERALTFGNNGGTIGTFGGGTLTINQNLAVGGSLTVAGGTVRLTGVNTFAAPINLSFGTLELVSDVDQTLGVAVNGFDGNLYKGGSNTVTLTQASQGILGAVIVDSGALRLQNGDALYRSLLTLNKNDGVILDFADSAALRVGGLAGSGNLALGAHNLIVDNGDDGTNGTPVYGGSISGTGSVTFNAPTSLTGKSAYTGGTVVGYGASLYLQTDSLIGDITSPGLGRLIFDQDTDGTFAGRIGGNLEVSKYGAGTVSLPGAMDVGYYRVYEGILEASLGGTFTKVDLYNATFRALSNGRVQWFEGPNDVIIDTNGYDVTATGLYTLGSTINNPPATVFIKKGAGTLTVADIADGRGERFDLLGGVLELGNTNSTGTFMGPRVFIGSGTELQGSGTLRKGAVLYSGGAISPGRESVPGELGIFAGTSLVWNDGGLLRFNLLQDGTGDLITLSGDLTKGTPGLSGFFFDLSGSSVEDGTLYTLMNFGSTNFIASDFRYRGLSNGFTGGFEMDGGALYFRAIGGIPTAVPETGALPLFLTLSPVAVLLFLRKRFGRTQRVG